MFQPRLIKTVADHRAALARIDVLMDAEDEHSADELELLATLVEAYEDEHFPIDLPSPVDAIRFRMQQEGLSNKDLEPFLGGSAKVSEILSGKRQLTLPMIRALNKHLGIPAEVLIQEPGASIPEEKQDVRWEAFPIAAMAKLGWTKFRHDAERAMSDLIQRAGGYDAVVQLAFRKNDGSRRNAKMDAHALSAWCVYVLAEARLQKLPRFAKGTVDQKFLSSVVKLSAYEDGPRRAVDFLAKHGIALVVAPHLPNTYVDGAAMMTVDATPVVGMTLRLDRVDNFWFCLLHELAHIGRHFDTEQIAFVDDLSLRTSEDDKKEKEADSWAEEALIPPKAWNNPAVREQTSASKVIAFAQGLGIHPAIVAGRIRWEKKQYSLLTQLVGNGEVRRHFPDVKWA